MNKVNPSPPKAPGGDLRTQTGAPTAAPMLSAVRAASAVGDAADHRFGRDAPLAGAGLPALPVQLSSASNPLASPRHRLMVRRLLSAVRAMPLAANHRRWLSSARQIGRSNESPLDAIGRETEDPFEQFTILALASEQQGGGGRGSSREHELELALRRLEEDFTLQVRAKTHAYVMALGDGELFSSPTAAAQAASGYAALVAQGDSLLSVFRSLLERYSVAHFERMRRWLIATLSAELQSRWVSREPCVLEMLRQHLYLAQTLAVLMSEAHATLLALAHRRQREPARSGEPRRGCASPRHGADAHPEEDGPEDPEHHDSGGEGRDGEGGDGEAPEADVAIPDDKILPLAGEVLELSAQAWLVPLRLEQLCGTYVEGDGPRTRLEWHGRLRRMVGVLPLGIFPDENAREQLLAELQARYDALAEEEDDWHA